MTAADRARDAIAGGFHARYCGFAPLGSEYCHCFNVTDVALAALDAAGLAVVDRDVADLAAHVDRLTWFHRVDCRARQFAPNGGLCNCGGWEARVALDRVRAREDFDFCDDHGWHSVERGCQKCRDEEAGRRG